VQISGAIVDDIDFPVVFVSASQILSCWFDEYDTYTDYHLFPVSDMGIQKNRKYHKKLMWSI